MVWKIVDMGSLDIFLFLLLMALGIVCTKTDIEKGLIYNKVLMPAMVFAVCIDVIYFVFWAPEFIYEFVINVLLIIAISLVLFWSNSFAGGDTKLVVALSLLYPAKCYWNYGNSTLTLFIAIAIAIFFGYLYLLVSSIISILKKNSNWSMAYVKGYLMNFVKSFFIAMIYLSAVNLIFNFLAINGISIYIWLARIISILIAWSVGKYQVFKKWYCILLVVCFDIGMSLFIKIIPISIYPENYILVFVLLLCQMTIMSAMYSTVQIYELKKGMILSVASSVLMQNSRVRGLPRISTEDLKSRLTDEEISSIRRWAESRNITELTIVKKIPFAIFILMGFVLYLVLWGVNL